MHVPILSMTLISVLHGYGDKAVRGRAIIFVGHPQLVRLTFTAPALWQHGVTRE
jgi:hypothetical protein